MKRQLILVLLGGLLSAAPGRAQTSAATSAINPSPQTTGLGVPTGPLAGTGLGGGTIGGAVGLGSLPAPVMTSPNVDITATRTPSGTQPATGTSAILTPAGTQPAMGSVTGASTAPSPAAAAMSSVGATAGPAGGFGPGPTIPGVTSIGESLSSSGTSVTPSSLATPSSGPVGAASSATAPAATPLYPDLFGD
jgi:hypothetical protein